MGVPVTAKKILESTSGIMQATLRKTEDVVGLFEALGKEERWGELGFQGAEGSAKLFLTKGRIAWAFASNQKESFQSILMREDGFTKEQLLEGIKKAREAGKRQLDEILTFLGVEDPARRIEVVTRHVVSAIEAVLALDEAHVTFKNMAPIPNMDANQGAPIAEVMTSVQIPQKRPAKSKPNYQTELAAAAVKDIPEILERLRFEIPSFLAAMVVESKTSLPVATLSDAPGLDIEIAGAFYRDLIRSAEEAMKALGKAKNEKAPLEEVVISSNDDYVILRTLKDGEHFLYLLLDQDSNPGMAKVAVRRYFEQLNAML